MHPGNRLRRIDCELRRAKPPIPLEPFKVSSGSINGIITTVGELTKCENIGADARETWNGKAEERHGWFSSKRSTDRTVSIRAYLLGARAFCCHVSGLQIGTDQINVALLRITMPAAPRGAHLYRIAALKDILPFRIDGVAIDP
jgi:hypothetical protein